MNSRNRTIDWPRTLLRACRIIEAAEAEPSLAVLAAELDLSASELHRQFTRRLGISPKAYAQALAMHRLVRDTQQAETALDAVYAAGFKSVSRAYAAASSKMGVPPGKLRTALTIGWWLGLSDLGWMLMAATDKGVCWLAFGDEPGTMLEELRATFPKARLLNDEARLRTWFDQVRDFALLPREALDLPVDVQGTAFQASVWQALQKVPFGATVSYREIADRLGKPEAVRAVASACARNKVALLVPCHRAIRANGELAGYRWGLQRKATLLRREQKP